MSQALAQSIARIENSIAAYYGFARRASVCDYLVTRAQLGKMIAAVESYPEWHAAGAVWLDARADMAFIAVHFDSEVIQSLTACSPWQRLSNTNLNSFCVLVEEVSHFHLLLNKIAHGIALPRLELELQGEIDKVIICADLLYRQTGSCHLPPLLQKIYDEPHTTSDRRYEQANDHAAAFFYRFLQRDSRPHTHSRCLRAFLQENYLCPWQQKLSTLLNPMFG